MHEIFVIIYLIFRIFKIVTPMNMKKYSIFIMYQSESPVWSNLVVFQNKKRKRQDQFPALTCVIINTIIIIIITLMIIIIIIT